MIERSPDIRKKVALEVETYLDAISRQTPPAGTVSKESGFNTEISNLSMALGPLIPMTITTWVSGITVTGEGSDNNQDVTINEADVTEGASLSFTMLINPASVNWGKTNASQVSYTRYGYVTQLWGPNQETITANGRSPAFMMAGEGLTNIGQRRSLGYKNLMSLMAAYRNNGYELIRRPTGNLVSRVINKVRGVVIDYDGSRILGHFTNFTLDNTADNPYAMDYNFEFVVSCGSNDYSQIRGHFAPPDPQVPRNNSLVVNQQTVTTYSSEQPQ